MTIYVKIYLIVQKYHFLEQQKIMFLGINITKYV